MRCGVLAALALVAWQASAAESNDFRFAIIGDRTGEATAGVYERVWEEVDRLRPDFVINVGDVIEGGDDSTAEQEWKQMAAVWRRYAYPLYFTPGNHDIWSAASERIYEKYTGRRPFYSFDYRSAHFTVLDNSRTENLSDGQLRFLERDLDENRSRPLKFVFFHRPSVWLIPLKFQSEFALHGVLKKYGVTAAFSGHTHQFARLERDGITYVCACSSGGHLRASGDAFAQGWFYGYVVATVQGSKVRLSVREVGAPLGKGRVWSPGAQY